MLGAKRLQSSMLKIIIVYTFSVAYAVVRYVVFNPENIDNLPVFVFNKGISMAAAFCFTLAFYSRWRARIPDRIGGAGAWFRAGIFGVFAHVPLSLAILNPEYFPEFYADGRLRFGGESVVFFGAVTLGGIYLLSKTDSILKHRWILSLATMAALLSHTLSMGIARGLNIDSRHGFLPPMWLLSMIGIALGIGFILKNHSDGASSGDCSSSTEDT
jgi:hypothetical protein